MPASGSLRRLGALIPLVFAVLVGLTLVAAPGASAAAKAPIDKKIDHAADVAISRIGDPYVYGAAGPNAFDCSGLSMFSYDHSALSLPRTAASQYASVHHIIK